MKRIIIYHSFASKMPAGDCYLPLIFLGIIYLSFLFSLKRRGEGRAPVRPFTRMRKHPVFVNNGQFDIEEP